MGDATVILELTAEIVAEMGAEGVCEYIVDGLVEGSVEAITSLAIEGEELKDNLKDFNKFSKKLSSVMAANDGSAGASTSTSDTLEKRNVMDEARDVREAFAACDEDGDGVISSLEFVHFSAAFGISRKAALETFRVGDKDGDGE